MLGAGFFDGWTNRQDETPRGFDEGGWHFRIEFGRPVPEKFLTKDPDLARIAKYLLDEMLPVIQRHPEQCSLELIQCFHRSLPARVNRNGVESGHDQPV